MNLSARSPRLALALLSSWLLACPSRRAVGFEVPPPDGAPITCPVTGTRCAKGPDTPAAVVDERTYYFCEPAASARFRADPGRYRDHP